MSQQSTQTVGEASSMVEQSIAGMVTAKTDKLTAITDLKHMIKHQLDLTERVETRRTQANLFALQTMTLCVAGVGVIVGVSRGSYSTMAQAAIVFLGTSALAALVITVVFEWQNSFRYPFLDLTKYGNSWRWFYYGNPKVQTLSTKLACLDRQEECVKFLQSLDYISARFGAETQESELAEAIQQFHLLQAHNYYKNKFFLQLCKIRKCGLMVAILAALVIGSLAGTQCSLLPQQTPADSGQAGEPAKPCLTLPATAQSSSVPQAPAGQGGQVGTGTPAKDTPRKPGQ